MSSSANSPSKTDAVLALTPPKHRARRATTSHLLVTSICKHIEAAVGEITEEDYVDAGGFEKLLERMAFLGDENFENCWVEDGKLLQNLWDAYSEQFEDGGRSYNGVSLSGCQRLLLQVLAGLEVNEELSNIPDALGSKKYTAQLSEIYNTRRLLQKPRHHRNLEQKHGLLHSKVSKHDTPQSGLTKSTKKKLRREGMQGGLLTPMSGAMVHASSAVATKTRRRASTFTSRLRIKKNGGKKKELEDHYR